MASDITAIVNSWSAEIDEISKIVDEWANTTIYIDIKQEDADKNEKFQMIKSRFEKFKESMQVRLDGLRSKIVNHLRSIYQTAKLKLEPYATLAEMLTNISADLGAIVSALKKMGELFLAMYTEPYETMLAIIQVVTQVIDLTAKLASLQVPKVVFRNGMTYSPAPPTWTPITMNDIIS